MSSVHSSHLSSQQNKPSPPHLICDRKTNTQTRQVAERGLTKKKIKEYLPAYQMLKKTKKNMFYFALAKTEAVTSMRHCGLFT